MVHYVFHICHACKEIYAPGVSCRDLMVRKLIPMTLPNKSLSGNPDHAYMYELVIWDYVVLYDLSRLYI